MRIGSILFGIGGLAVLGTTFGIGVLAGRHWRPAWAPAPAQARTEADARPAPKGPETPRVTFYGELPAPPAAPATTPASVTPPVPGPAAPVVTRSAPAPPAPRRAPARTPEAPGRFTVQVGAFRTRAQADALRASLRAAGQEAYLVEPEDGAAPWRVRVGAHGSREAATLAAERLAAERRLQTFVTSR